MVILSKSGTLGQYMHGPGTYTYAQYCSKGSQFNQWTACRTILEIITLEATQNTASIIRSVANRASGINVRRSDRFISQAQSVPSHKVPL